MTGITPVDTLGYNPYQAYNQYYYYPAPQYAAPVQVPYPQFVTVPQGGQIQIAPKEDEVVKTAEKATTFEASKEIQPEKKSHGKAWAILGTLATIGLACLGRKAYKIGSTELAGFAKLADGAKILKQNCWNGCQSLWTRTSDTWKNIIARFKESKSIPATEAVPV